MKLHLWGILQEFIFVIPTIYSFKYCHKRPICKDILKKWVIYLPWKTYWYGYAIFLIFLTKSMRNPNTQLVHFSYLFEVASDCRLGCVRSRANFWVLLCILQSLLKCLDRGLMSIWSWFIFQWQITRMNLWKPVSDLAVSNDTLTINLSNFLSYFCGILFSLKFH